MFSLQFLSCDPIDQLPQSLIDLVVDHHASNTRLWPTDAFATICRLLTKNHLIPRHPTDITPIEYLKCAEERLQSLLAIHRDAPEQRTVQAMLNWIKTKRRSAIHAFNRHFIQTMIYNDALEGLKTEQRNDQLGSTSIIGDRPGYECGLTLVALPGHVDVKIQPWSRHTRIDQAYREWFSPQTIVQCHHDREHTNRWSSLPLDLIKIILSLAFPAYPKLKNQSDLKKYYQSAIKKHKSAPTSPHEIENLPAWYDFQVINDDLALVQPSIKTKLSRTALRSALKSDSTCLFFFPPCTYPGAQLSPKERTSIINHVIALSPSRS